MPDEEECLIKDGIAAKSEGIRMELLWSGASEWKSSSSKPWMNVLFMSAAERGGSFWDCEHVTLVLLLREGME